ncbi:MAG: elongation factor G [Acidimicrobiales bacterium]
MNPYPSNQIRNVAFVGHGGAGKTSLVEALLYCTGNIARPGRVEDGNTVCDFEPEEVKRHISVSLAVAAAEYQGFKLNLIDAPGYADFSGEVSAALSAADMAVFVVSAVEGVEVQTEWAWRLAASHELPRMIFINKLDRERAGFQRTLEQLRDHFGAGIAPLELPIGAEGAFCGIADLLTDTAYIYADGQATPGRIPTDMEPLEHQVHDNLVEGIVVADDSLTERYLDGDLPTAAELEATLAAGVGAASVFPVVCGSATRNIGIDRLAAFLCEIGPSPLQRPPIVARAGDAKTEVACDQGGPPLAQVFKTVADPYVGKVSLFKVLSGTLRPDTTLTNSTRHSEERLHGLFAMKGKEQITVASIPAGDIGAVAKLALLATGDTLAPKNMPVVVDSFALEPPALTVAIKPRSNGDEDKLMTALHRLCDEDPTLVIERNDETHQTLLSGMGETHLGIVAERLSRKFGVEVLTEEVLVPYRETISAGAEAEGKYKKQTGGHGQYGVVELRISPLERGGGFSFVDKVVGGAIPRQFIPAVEKGVAEAMAMGGVTGYPVVDVEVTCLDGKHHPVDSSEMSFKMAASLGFKEAMAKAAPVLLEPISHLEVTVPANYQGEVMGDLNSRRGRLQGTDAGPHGHQIIVALVPTAEVMRYAIDLRAITGGRGRFSLRHDHYDVAPSHLAQKLSRRTPD